jgi:hypothetical protein
MRIRRRLAQLGLFMVALPLVEERRPGSGRWLRQGSDLAHGFGRGPLSSRLRGPRP